MNLIKAPARADRFQKIKSSFGNFRRHALMHVLITVYISYICSRHMTMENSHIKHELSSQ